MQSLLPASCFVFAVGDCNLNSSAPHRASSTASYKGTSDLHCFPYSKRSKTIVRRIFSRKMFGNFSRYYNDNFWGKSVTMNKHGCKCQTYWAQALPMSAGSHSCGSLPQVLLPYGNSAPFCFTQAKSCQFAGALPHLSLLGRRTLLILAGYPTVIAIPTCAQSF